VVETGAQCVCVCDGVCVRERLRVYLRGLGVVCQPRALGRYAGVRGLGGLLNWRESFDRR